MKIKNPFRQAIIEIMGDCAFITFKAFDETIDEVKPEDLPKLTEEVNRIIEGNYVEVIGIPLDEKNDKNEEKEEK